MIGRKNSNKMIGNTPADIRERIVIIGGIKYAII